MRLMETPSGAEAKPRNIVDFLQATTELREQLNAHQREMETQARTAAQALNATAEITLTCAPLVITGTVDGRAYYLRERHGSYRIALAHPDTPEANPWWNSPHGHEVVIQHGSEEELTDNDGYLDITKTVTLVVNSVREHLLQQNCAHTQTRQGEKPRYCPNCGKNLSEASTPHH